MVQRVVLRKRRHVDIKLVIGNPFCDVGDMLKIIHHFLERGQKFVVVGARANREHHLAFRDLMRQYGDFAHRTNQQVEMRFRRVEIPLAFRRHFVGNFSPRNVVEIRGRLLDGREKRGDDIVDAFHQFPPIAGKRLKIASRRQLPLLHRLTQAFDFTLDALRRFRHVAHRRVKLPDFIRAAARNVDGHVAVGDLHGDAG